MFNSTTKVVMIVSAVSPTPFALLRRAKHFEYRDDDEALQQFSTFDDPVKILTDECRRVLNCISSTNQSETIAPSPGLEVPDPSWSQFEDLGFGNFSNDINKGPSDDLQSIRSAARSRTDVQGRPTTPSWADFLSTGFANAGSASNSGNYLLPPDKSLPPLANRSQSSQSFRPSDEDPLEPGELASITRVDLDETFWWVWMASLAGEEPAERKKVFGRCAIVETGIPGSRWLVMEEQVKGASPGQDEGAYIVEKKGRFSFTKRGKLGRRKSSTKNVSGPNQPPKLENNVLMPPRKASISPEQQAKVQAAAYQLAQNEREAQNPRRRSRTDESVSQKTNSVLSLQPVLMSEAGPAMKWVKEFDKDALRAKYLGDPNAGKGSAVELKSTYDEAPSSQSNGLLNRELPNAPETSEVNPSRKESPLPATPIGDGRLAPKEPSEQNIVAAEAFDEKVQPAVDDHEQHPAYRKPSPNDTSITEPGPVAAARKAWESRESTPASSANVLERKPSPKRPHKPQHTKSGFKKLFGRKQSETKPQIAPPEPYKMPEQSHEDISRQESTVSDGPDSFKQRSFGEDDIAAAPAPIVMPVGQPRAIQTPDAVSDVNPSPQVSRVNTNDPHDPNPALSRLDQGPLQDVPAFVPDDSETEISEPSPAVKEQPPRPVEAPMPVQIKEEVADVQKVATPEPEEKEAEYIAPVQDRWAQIRKNAAERAVGRNATASGGSAAAVGTAAATSPSLADRSGQSSNPREGQGSRADEGYTSEEETIESRVARIKARVAELTGNGDMQAPGLAPGR